MQLLFSAAQRVVFAVVEKSSDEIECVFRKRGRLNRNYLSRIISRYQEAWGAHSELMEVVHIGHDEL